MHELVGGAHGARVAQRLASRSAWSWIAQPLERVRDVPACLRPTDLEGKLVLDRAEAKRADDAEARVVALEEELHQRGG